jgi:iron complex outermembrane receptor protein/outer membrane receptor for ferric coprogen and ferric-rhodotorulic acid
MPSAPSGSRLSWAEYDVQSPVNEPYATGRQFIPYAGLVYDPNGHHSLYASYTSIYQIQDYWPRRPAGPRQGQQLRNRHQEQLLRRPPADRAVGVQSELTNLPEELTSTPPAAPPAFSRYTEGGKVRNRGFEIEASGSPCRLNLSAGYSHSHPSMCRAAARAWTTTPLTPRKLLKLATDYLPGGQWRLGGDVHAKHPQQPCPTWPRAATPLLNRTPTQHDRHLSVQFNVRNATDKHYYQTIPSRANWGNLMTGTRAALP